jgi:hypothetical protein
MKIIEIKKDNFLQLSLKLVGTTRFELATPSTPC